MKASRRIVWGVACVAGLWSVAFLNTRLPASAGVSFPLIEQAEAATPSKVVMYASAEAALPAPPRKAVAPHSRKVEDEPQGIALSAPAPERESGLKGAKTETKTAALEEDKTTEAAPEKIKKTKGSRAHPHKKSKKIQKKNKPVHVEEVKPVEESSSPLLGTAQQKMDENDFAGARDLYDQLLAQKTDVAAAWKGKAAALEKTATPEAEAELEKMTQDKAVQSGAAQAALAQLLLKRGKNDEAIAHLWAAIAAEPANDQYRLSLAIMFDRTGKTDLALSLYRKIRQPLPVSVKRRVDALTAHVDQKASDENL